MIVKKIILHCSDSDLASHDNIETINAWHKARGWRKVGYHYFINKQGLIAIGRQEDEQGAHTKGHNNDSISICISGKSDFNNKQFDETKKLIKNLLYNRDLTMQDVYPHNYFNKNKTCPNFDIKVITGVNNGN